MSPHTKGKEQKKHQWRKKQQSLGGGRGEGAGEKMAERTQHEGKLIVPMNYMINVASYWA